MNFISQHKINLNPWQYLVISFVILISFGTLLLQLPFVKHTNGIALIDALFTSTSAVCVTGLTTITTSGFNTAGQLAILLLIQLGAIGIMTLTSSFLLAIKGNIGLKHKMLFSQIQENVGLHDAHLVLRNILKITFFTEFIGFIVLSIGFKMEGLALPQAMYQGFFHSISAFCNAGFSTYDQSIIGMNPLIKYTISFLIIIGGIGYFVIYELLEKYKTKRRLSLHTKIVLITSIALIVIGTLLIYFFQFSSISFNDSFFQSVTTRTAGFNSVDLNKLPITIIFLMMLLMFIGASPGSTGGGIKTTTFFVMFYSIISVLKGKTEVSLFKRNISIHYILKAFATTILYIGVIVIGIILLLETNHIKMIDAIFEVVSAIGTVGLSLGITPILNDFGKVILVLLMFVGRLGPASFALATLNKQKNILIKYPKGEIY